MAQVAPYHLLKTTHSEDKSKRIKQDICILIYSVFVLRSSEKYLKERNVSKLSDVMVHSPSETGITCIWSLCTWKQQRDTLKVCLSCVLKRLTSIYRGSTSECGTFCNTKKKCKSRFSNKPVVFAVVNVRLVIPFNGLCIEFRLLNALP